MRRIAAFLLWSSLLGGVSWGQEGPAVLFPQSGARTRGTSLWLVIRSGYEPQLTLDGRALTAAHGEGGVYHWRLEGLRAEGSRVARQDRGQDIALTVYGGSREADRFHVRPPEACWECHRQGEEGCVECHHWVGDKHAPVLAQGCGRCHQPPQWEPEEVAPICGVCHPDYASGRHPRLRHPVRAARDPLRPGRAMDCASCHDPHSPRCLSCLGRGELREWCRNCHGGP